MKKLIAFLLVFTMLAVGFTYVQIQRTLGEPLIRTKVDLPNEEIIPEAGVDLMGTYDQNHLVITELAEAYQGVQLTYPAVDGLKDRQVQEAVNLGISHEVQGLKDYFEGQGIHMDYLTYQIHGNFSNVLSVGLFSGNESGVTKRAYLNFNLNDGSQIRLQDVFCAQADVQAIVHSAFYDALTTGNLTGYYWEQNNSPDEYELYKVVREYLGQSQPQFAVAPDGIYLYWEDYMATVDMVAHAADIAVYNRFLSEESIFLRDDIGATDMFTCAVLPEGFDRRSFGYGGENLWYDVAMADAYLDESLPAQVREAVTAYIQTVYEGLLAEVEALQQIAAEHPEKAYILMAQPSVYLYQNSEYVDGQWQNTPSKAVIVNENYVLYETSRELFENKYLHALISEYRRNPYYLFYEGIDQYLDGGEVDYIKRKQNRLVLYENGAALTENGVFADGYDHGAAVRSQAKYELMGYHGYTMEEAELAVQSLWYELAGDGLQVRIPAWDRERYIWIPLSDFPTDALTIFD